MSRVFDFDRAILRAPAPSVVDGLRAGGGPSPRYDAVLAEHRAYADALAAAGVLVDMLPPLDEFPDALFVEDPALVFTQGAILLRPGAASRAGEVAQIRPALERHFETVVDLPAGFADGGDVLVTPARVMIGLSARTDREGAAALAAILGGWGMAAEVVAPPPTALHLKTISSLVDEETILTTPEGAASGLFGGFRLIVTPTGEEGAANALRVNDVLLAGSRFPRTIEALAAHGLSVVPLETSEIALIDAGLSCMSLRWTA
jgi:dimethylargininase